MKPRTTRQAAWIAATALIVAVLVGCTTPKPSIRTNAVPGSNPSSYETYSFVPKPGTDRGEVSTPLTAYFKEAVRREMDSRGFRYIETGGELLVNFNANARENVDLRTTPGPAYSYYGYRSGMYGVAGGNEVETVRYRVGTVNVDIVDAGKRQLIWEAIAEGRLTDKVMKDPAAAVNAVVKEMFTTFPSRSGAPVHNQTKE